jgi:hypothetical protein
MSVSSIIKGCRGPCIGKMDCCLKEKKKGIPPVESCTIIRDLPIMVMCMAVPLSQVLEYLLLKRQNFIL